MLRGFMGESRVSANQTQMKWSAEAVSFPTSPIAMDEAANPIDDGMLGK
jgi:hypothetical protein